jgi:ABC-type multidrug transport system fused ATPase/permease subunit
VLVVLPSLYFGRRVQRPSRASQDRVADSSAIAAEVLNAVPVVQSYLQEAREAERFTLSTERAFGTAVTRSRMPFRSRSSSVHAFGALPVACPRGRRRWCTATSPPAISARPSST